MIKSNIFQIRIIKAISKRNYPIKLMIRKVTIFKNNITTYTIHRKWSNIDLISYSKFLKSFYKLCTIN